MADIHEPSNRKFWATPVHKREPVRLQQSATAKSNYEHFLHGKEYYLAQAVFHGYHSGIVGKMEDFFDKGCSQEYKDLQEIVRQNS